MASVLAFTGYFITLAPDVTLGFSGIFATGAFYAGVPHPPGYPVWTLYAWVFTNLLPFSNIAWRAAVSSAVAGALACGVIALLVSRGGAMLLDGTRGLTRLPPREENLLRVATGCVAGLGFGFNGASWSTAVTADVWPLSLLLLSLVLTSLLRWLYTPKRTRHLLAASFLFGLMLANSLSLPVAAPGFAVMLLLGDRDVGRDALFCIGLLLAGIVLAQWKDSKPEIPVITHVFAALALLTHAETVANFYALLAALALLTSAWLAIKNRALLTRWRTVLASASAMALGLSLYFFVPISSMTNPPMNWAYPRTVTGFFHGLTRGQYERIHPTSSLLQFVAQIGTYFKCAIVDFGLLYLAAALIPFFFLRRMGKEQRRWMGGLLAVYLSLSLLMVWLLNPPTDFHLIGLPKVYFTASYIILAISAGYGLLLAGCFLRARPN